MPTPATCLFFAEPSDLQVLRSEGLLPEDFLGVYDRSLEDTAQLDFENLLGSHSVVAFPRQLLSDKAGLDEALSARAATKYRDNLRQYLAGHQSVRLMILHHPPQDIPEQPDPQTGSLDGLGDELETLAKVWKENGVDASLTYIVVATRELNRADVAGLDRIRDCPMVNRVYLMTHQLNPSPGGSLIRAEYIWPLAVSRLLCRLIARPPKHTSANPKRASLLCWRSVDFGPDIDTQTPEALRIEWTKEAMGLLCESAQGFKDAVNRIGQLLEIHAEIPSAAQTSRTPQGQSNSGATFNNVPEDKGPLGAWEAGCRDSGVRLVTNVIGRQRWERTSEDIGAGWRDIVAQATTSRGQDDASEALHRVFSETGENPSRIGAAADLHAPPPEPSNALQRRQDVAALQRLRESRYAEERDCVLAAAEWDAANDRLVPWQDRVIVAIAPVLLLSMQGSLVIYAAGVRRVYLLCSILGVAVIAATGAAIAIAWSWRTEKRRLDCAAAVLRTQVRQAETAGEEIRNRPVQIAVKSAQAQALRTRRSVTVLVANIAKRTRRMLELAVDRGTLKLDATPESLPDRIPPDEHVLAVQDRREYVSGIRATVGDKHSLGKLRTSDSDNKLNTEKIQICTEFLSHWREWAKDSDPQCRGHYAYAKLFPKLEDWALAVRDRIWSLAVEQAVEDMRNGRTEISDDLKRTCGLLEAQTDPWARPCLSCRVTRTASHKPETTVDKTERFTFVYRGKLDRNGSEPIREFSVKLIAATREKFDAFVAEGDQPLPSPRLPVPAMMFEELPVHLSMSTQNEMTIAIRSDP
jgi:hypothetical protein